MLVTELLPHTVIGVQGGLHPQVFTPERDRQALPVICICVCVRVCMYKSIYIIMMINVVKVAGSTVPSSFKSVTD